MIRLVGVENDVADLEAAPEHDVHAFLPGATMMVTRVIGHLVDRSLGRSGRDGKPTWPTRMAGKLPLQTRGQWSSRGLREGLAR